jgi:hypothetical protein
LFVCLFVCTTLRAQTLNFVLSVDTIAIGDTLTVNNTSSYRIANDNQKEKNKNTLDIYPNPAKDFVFIKCIGSITYEITDVAGKQYKQGDFDLQGNAVVSINIEQLLQGVYIVKATQEDCTKVARIVVIK